MIVDSKSPSLEVKGGKAAKNEALSQRALAEIQAIAEERA